MSDQPAKEVSEEAARAGYSASVIASGRCPECQGELPPGRKACSGKCRAALSRRRQHEARRARDREIRTLLEEALRRLGEASP